MQCSPGMKTSARLIVAPIALSAAVLTGCSFASDSPAECPSGMLCDSSTLAGPAHGTRADGTPDVTVDEAWPDRNAEPAPLSATELAQACALLAACSPGQCQDGSCDADSERQQVFVACVIPGLSYFWEERAVPASDKSERWTFEAREILKSAGDCGLVLGASTQRAAPIVCEEAGCWWLSANEPIPSVTCQGDVATLTTASHTYVRDCSRALQHCDTSAATGCTDRRPTACEHPAKDRCDGAVRIGCDGNGRVSFHDCARVPGGTCGELEGGGLGCVYPNAGQCDVGESECDGDSVKTCVLGDWVTMDCRALGLGGCKGGACVKRGG